MSSTWVTYRGRADGRGRNGRSPLSMGVVIGMSTIIWLGIVVAVIGGGALLGHDTAIAELTTREVNLRLGPNFDIVPDVVEIHPFTDLILNIENVDDIQHDLQITSGAGTDRLKPGESTVLPAGYISDRVAIFCSIKGHREQGMEATILVLIEPDD